MVANTKPGVCDTGTKFGTDQTSIDVYVYDHEISYLSISIFTSTIYLMELDCDGGLSLVLEMTFDFKCFPNLIGRYGNRWCSFFKGVSRQSSR